MARYQIDNIASPIDWKAAKGAERTLQNAKNLLMCRMGEVPYDRCRGFDPAVYDLPIGRMKEELLPELDRTMLWEPGVQVVRAEARILDNGGVYVRAEIEITER